MQTTGTIETKGIYPEVALFLIIILHMGVGWLTFLTFKEMLKHFSLRKEEKNFYTIHYIIIQV